MSREKVFVLDLRLAKVAVNGGLKVSKLADFLVSTLRLEPWHLYYFCDEKECRIVSHEELLDTFNMDDPLGIFLGPRYRRRDCRLLKSHDISVKEMVECLGVEFFFIYDMGEEHTFRIKVEEILTKKHFKELYGDLKLPAILKSLHKTLS